MALIFGALCSCCIRHDTIHKFLRQLDVLDLDLLRETVRLAEVLNSGRLLDSSLLHAWQRLDSRDIAAVREDLRAATFQGGKVGRRVLLLMQWLLAKSGLRIDSTQQSDTASTAPCS